MLPSHGLQHPGQGLGCDPAVLEVLGGDSRDGDVQGEGEALLGTALTFPGPVPVVQHLVVGLGCLGDAGEAAEEH